MSNATLINFAKELRENYQQYKLQGQPAWIGQLVRKYEPHEPPATPLGVPYEQALIEHFLHNFPALARCFSEAGDAKACEDFTTRFFDYSNGWHVDFLDWLIDGCDGPARELGLALERGYVQQQFGGKKRV